MKMYVGIEWVDKPKTIPVLNPYDGSQVDTVPRADADDIERALATEQTNESAVVDEPFERTTGAEIDVHLVQVSGRHRRRISAESENRHIGRRGLYQGLAKKAGRASHQYAHV